MKAPNPVMPKVHFVHEHITAEVESGRLLSAVAQELGIPTCRKTAYNTLVGNHTVWVQGEPGALSPRTLWERLWRLRGWRRFANRARVLGDVQVWTQQGLDGQQAVIGSIDPPPQPVSDADAPRHEPSAAGTAHCPYGHPKAVGKGTREPPAYQPPAKKKAPAKKAAGDKAAAAKPAAKKAPPPKKAAPAGEGGEAKKAPPPKKAAPAGEGVEAKKPPPPKKAAPAGEGGEAKKAPPPKKAAPADENAD